MAGEKLHTHEFYELLIYVSADMQYISDRQYYSTPRGRASCTEPRTYHINRLRAPSLCNRYVLYFSSAFIDLLMPGKPQIFDFIRGRGGTVRLFFPEPVQGEIFGPLEQIEGELTEQSSYSAALICARLTELFVLFSTRSADENGDPGDASAQIPEFLKAVKEYIDEHYAAGLTLGGIAEHFYYSPEHISRAFRKYFNMTVGEYIRSRRLTLTCSCLRRGLSVEEAAHTAGFHNMSSFIRQFRQHTGMLPSEYRNRHGKPL